MESVMSSLPHLNIVEENNLYAVGWVRNMDEIKEVLSSFMGKTNLDYRMYRKTKNFGYRGLPEKDFVVRFVSRSGKKDEDSDDEDPDQTTIPVVPFQGYPFVILSGESHMGCKFGKNAWAASAARRQVKRKTCQRMRAQSVFQIRLRMTMKKRASFPLCHFRVSASLFCQESRTWDANSDQIILIRKMKNVKLRDRSGTSAKDNYSACFITTDTLDCIPETNFLIRFENYTQKKQRSTTGHVAQNTEDDNSKDNAEADEDPNVSELHVVPFQGHPFIILSNDLTYDCKFGKDCDIQYRRKQQRLKPQAENPKLKTRKPRTSIKLGCPAQIMIKETFCFVDYQCEYSQYHVKKLQGILREKLLAGEGLNVEKRLYIRLPKTAVHQFHEIPEITDGDTSMDTSTLLRSSTIIKPEGTDDDDNDMDVAPPDDDDLDEDNMSIQSVARQVKPTWTALFDEKYSDLYGWVGTADKADRLLREYERVTNTHFVPQKLSKELGLSEVISLEGQRIIWEDGGFTACTGDGQLRIPFEGCPMILLNVKIYKCELGKYKKVKGVAHYGCWMYVKMKEVIVFPEYALPEGLAFNTVERMKMQNCLTADVKEGKPVEAQRRIYIALIPPEDHKHSVTMGRPNDVSPDQQLCDRMRDLISMGISSSDLITRHLHNMTVNEIYKDKKPPSRDNKKFFPTEAKIGDYIEVSKRTTKFDGVNFKTRAREREELMAACKNLMEDCEKMMHLICGKTALDDVREKLELLHRTMKLYTPDMTHPEVNEVLPYIIDGVEPPTPHQRALAAVGKGKLAGITYSPKKKKRKRGEGDVYGEQNVSDLTSLFTNEDSDDSEASNLSAGYSQIIQPQPTEEAELTAAAAQSLVEINQPFHITTANQTVLEATSQPVYQTTVTTIPQAENSSTQQYATLTPVPITKTSLIKTSTPKTVKTTPVIKVLRNPVKGSSPVKVEVGSASFLQLLPGTPVTVQKVVTVTGDNVVASHVETTGADLSVGLNIETQSDDQMGEIT